MTMIRKGPTGPDPTRHITPVPFPAGDPLACRTITHDICVVTDDGHHHTYDRFHPDRGVVVSGGHLITPRGRQRQGRLR